MCHSWSCSVSAVGLVPICTIPIPSFADVPKLSALMPPPRIELGLRVPETLVMSFSLRGRARDGSVPRDLQVVNASPSKADHVDALLGYVVE